MANQFPFLLCRFDSHLGFLGGGEDHFTQMAGGLVDLWRDNAPAHGENGTYSCDLYGTEVVKVIKAHPPSDPLFVYLPLHDTHSPYECTPKWMDSRVKQPLRQLMQCMLTCTDDITGQVVEQLRSKQMWDNTLMVWSADSKLMTIRCLVEYSVQLSARPVPQLTIHVCCRWWPTVLGSQ